MKKGFTLMEILAVVMVVALVASMGVPAYKYVRQEMRNSQARAAALKLAEGVRTFYVNSKGGKIKPGCFSPTEPAGRDIVFSSTCNDVTTTGIPGNNKCGTNSVNCPVSLLFGCGFLSYRDFAEIPYNFCVCDPDSSSCGTDLLVKVTGNSVAGKYSGHSFAITKDMLEQDL